MMNPHIINKCTICTGIFKNQLTAIGINHSMSITYMNTIRVI